MDKDGYPTKYELNKITTWDFLKKPITEFLEYIRQRWNWADIGYFDLSGKRILKLQLHTGGWSGNESIISAMRDNWIFWMMCWQKSERGGHYWFRIDLRLHPKIKLKTLKQKGE